MKCVLIIINEYINYIFFLVKYNYCCNKFDYKFYNFFYLNQLKNKKLYLDIVFVGSLFNG